MPIYKTKTPTKDGRSWFFKVSYRMGTNNEIKLRKTSKKYSTKQEAMKAEYDFLNYVVQHQNIPFDMTFKNLIKDFLNYKKDKVKYSTYSGYLNSFKHLKCFYKIKCVDYNINHYLNWKKKMNKLKISTVYKNDLLKLWKAVLNYGTTWYGFNFTAIYNKMDNFTNPNEPKKEMKFYTLEEFNKFIKRSRF